MSNYLDYNASTPLDIRVLHTMIDVYQNQYGNADSRTHSFGEVARKVVEDSRNSISKLLQVNKNEVSFTSGATESNNIVMLGLQEYAEQSGKKHIITTAIEHKSILEPLRILESKGFDVTYINPDSKGRINADELLSKVRNDTLLVSVMHVNNETGVIQPVEEIGEELSRAGVLFHIDAAQSFGKMVEELSRIKFSSLSASAHKMYGPQGIGILVLRKEHYKSPPIKPIMFGGNQEQGIRPGTTPTALVAGIGKAAEIALSEYKSNLAKYQLIKHRIIELLDSSKVEYEINGDIEHSIPNTINLSFNGVNSEALMLATKDYCGISNGSACNSHSYKPSHVLTAMGLDIGRIESAVRISWGIDDSFFDDFCSLLQIAKSL